MEIRRLEIRLFCPDLSDSRGNTRTDVEIPGLTWKYPDSRGNFRHFWKFLANVNIPVFLVCLEYIISCFICFKLI